MKRYQYLLLSSFILIFSNSCFASPASKDTVYEVLHASKVDQIIKSMQNERYINFYSDSMIKGLKEANPNITQLQEQQIREHIKKYLQSTDFEIYFKNQLSWPFLSYFEEEELIHLLQIYEAPLAQQFFEQEYKRYLDLNDESFKKYSLTKEKYLEEKIQKMLNTL